MFEKFLDLQNPKEYAKFISKYPKVNEVQHLNEIISLANEPKGHVLKSPDPHRI